MAMPNNVMDGTKFDLVKIAAALRKSFDSGDSSDLEDIMQDFLSDVTGLTSKERTAEVRVYLDDGLGGSDEELFFKANKITEKTWRLMARDFWLDDLEKLLPEFFSRALTEECFGFWEFLGTRKEVDRFFSSPKIKEMRVAYLAYVRAEAKKYGNTEIGKATVGLSKVKQLTKLANELGYVISKPGKDSKVMLFGAHASSKPKLAAKKTVFNKKKIVKKLPLNKINSVAFTKA